MCASVFGSHNVSGKRFASIKLWQLLKSLWVEKSYIEYSVTRQDGSTWEVRLALDLLREKRAGVEKKSCDRVAIVRDKKIH